jgi:hypothetical protein
MPDPTGPYQGSTPIGDMPPPPPIGSANARHEPDLLAELDDADCVCPDPDDPDSATVHRCPSCAAQLIAELTRERDEAQHELARAAALLSRFSERARDAAAGEGLAGRMEAALDDWDDRFQRLYAQLRDLDVEVKWARRSRDQIAAEYARHMGTCVPDPWIMVTDDHGHVIVRSEPSRPGTPAEPRLGVGLLVQQVMRSFTDRTELWELVTIEQLTRPWGTLNRERQEMLLRIGATLFDAGRRAALDRDALAPRLAAALQNFACCGWSCCSGYHDRREGREAGQRCLNTQQAVADVLEVLGC